MIQRYREKKFIDAVQFENTYERITEIIGFVGLPVSVEYTSTGVQMRIVRTPYNVIIVKVGEYIAKADDSTLIVLTAADLAENYDMVTD
ncbi:hypothetical protein [Paenibacillus phocaensis]|uniref:hypothetical protein n=1 Tax=Paenibacillus phocaensis TaxID=1776378 RepID=UPI000839B4D8|nr:hypothetical protein [Paenibacillus phocaensis]